MTVLESPPTPTSSPPPSQGGSDHGIGWLATIGAAVVVAVVAFGLARVGKNAIYGVVGVTAIVVVGWSVRDLIGPPLADALRRAGPRPIGAPPLGPIRVILGVLVAAVATAFAAFAITGAGHKLLYALGALMALVVGLWMLWPAVLLLFDTPPEPRVIRRDDQRRRTQQQWSAIGLGKIPGLKRRPLGALARRTSTVVCVVAAGGTAFVAAKMGSKALLALVGLVIFTAALVRARDKSLFAVFATVCSLTLLEHKSFGAIDTAIAGGAPSIYVTSFDAMVLVLYVLWLREGTFLADVREGFHRRIMWVPLAALLLMLPSLLAPGTSLNLGLAEIVRMSWMYLLFFYVAVRVRTRAMVWAILGGFAVFALIEIVVCLLQWKTGGVLGLSFLGVPKTLTLRVTDTSQLGRPFGTIIHPDFMGAAMGSLGLVGFALGITLRRSLAKAAGFALALGCWLCLYLAHTRSALVGLIIAIVGTVVITYTRNQLSGRTIRRAILVLLVATAVFFPQIQGQIANNIGTSHFHEEISSRVQLNSVAEEMWADYPILGVGLNNFQNAMGPYETHGVIFIQNPVQDLYLLYLSETGVFGAAGFLLIGISMFAVTWRLARSRDRLFGGIGLGVAAMMVFLSVEELLDFALREDVPLAVYWIFAGLVVAGCRMTGLDDRGVARLGHGDPLADAESRLDGFVRSGPAAVPASREVQAHIARQGTTTTLRDEQRRSDNRTVPGRRSSRRRPARSAHTFAAIRRRVIFAPLVAVLGLASATGASAAVSHALGSSGTPISEMRVVYAAESNGLGGAPGVSGIFEANADGSGLTTILQAAPDSTTVYGWPQWALGGTKIIYTVRNGPAISSTDPYGSYENIWEMNPDGSDQHQLTTYNFRAVQPKVSADGKSVIFNGQNPAFPVDAIYQLNLLTLQATNLSAITQPNGALDVDPSWTSDGQIIFATTVGSSPGEGIEEMHADGTGRQVLINDGSFNTDPTLSPNDNEVAVSAYLGTNPAATGSVPTAADPDKTLLDPQDWIVQLHNESTGQTTALTAGDACLSLTVTCLPGQSSGWQPHWSPDGETVAWIGRLNAATSCVCASGADGSNPQVLIETSTEDITWFDWTAPGGTAPAGAVPSAAIGSEAVTSRLLVSGENLVDDQDEILDAPADLMGGSPVATGAATDPVDASWSSDSSTFVFVANAPYDPHHPHYGPPPPKGHRVHVDFSLRQLNPLLPGYAPDKTPATEQVFLHRADGTVVQLTTPWTEDWRDAIEPGDARANTDPVISPNGRYVVFVNHSGQTGESFLLRMDLRTGAVLNLTNGNAGAMEVNDALPKFSPNGKEIAFTWTHGIDTDVAVMNTANGRTVTSVTDDGYDMDPAWSPNGKSIVFSHYHGRLDPTAAELDALTDLPAKRWSLVEVNVATGHETVLTTPGSSPTWRPVFSPDGQAIDFISLKYQTKGVFQTSANGGKVEPVLVMPDFNVTGVDWK